MFPEKAIGRGELGIGRVSRADGKEEGRRKTCNRATGTEWI